MKSNEGIAADCSNLPGWSMDGRSEAHIESDITP